MSVGPLSHLEIDCWSRLMGLDPPIRPFEVDTLRQLDRICRNYYYERAHPEPGPPATIKDITAAVNAYKAGEAAERIPSKIGRR